MKQEAVLVIVKPDGINKQLADKVLWKFAKANLQIIAARVTRARLEQAEEHYQHIRTQPFFGETVGLLMGEFHRQKEILLLVYRGTDAIRKCRRIAGATNPREASAQSIRGLYGAVTKKGVFENVVHVSSSSTEARREIQLWFDPGDITIDLYPTKTKTVSMKKRIWK